MSEECLPEGVLDALRDVVGGEVITVRKVADSDVGTSWIVEIIDPNGSRSLFVKCARDGGGTKFASEGEIYFWNESVFYGEISEEFSKLCIPFASAAKCTGVYTGEGLAFLALENLVVQGYKPLDVREPVSLECAKLVLRRLGAFHAYSFALKDQKQDVFVDATSKLRETVFRPETRKLFLYAVHDALKLVRQSLPKGSVYAEKLGMFTLNVFEIVSDLAKGRLEEDHVITHGDLWPNNILYNAQEDVKFVDFNACRLSSPVHDLMFVLLLGLNSRTRDEFRDDLLVCYHGALCEKLQELGSDPLRLFPFSALRRQLFKQARFALVMALVGLPLFMYDGSMAATTATTTTTEEQTDEADALMAYIQKVHTGKTMKCKNKMIEIVMDVVDQGYLD